MEDNLNPEPHNVDKALEDTMAELDKPEIPEEKPEESKPSEAPIVPKENDDTPDEGEKPTEDNEPEDKKESKEVDDGDEDETEEEKNYKKRYADSSREATILAAKLKKQNEALEQAGSIVKPTIEEMKEEFAEWDEMSATEQRLAIDSVWNNRRFGLIEGVAKETKDIEAWSKRVDDYVSDPKVLIDNPRLEGKEDAFKAFCAKEKHRGVEFGILVDSYLYNVDKERKPKKGQMFEQPSGGANEAPKPKSEKLSVDESAKLMESDYSKWQEYLQAGKLDDGTSSL